MAMRDVGLVTGMKALWEEGILWDYTIKVEGQELKAHKLVLASVSRYFKAMFSEQFVESKANEVELQGLNADTVSKLLEFIYTREEQSIAGIIFDILKCTIYLQMPQVAEFCVNKIVKDLNDKNCLDALSVFIDYSFHDEVEKVKSFIKLNWWAVLDSHEVADMSPDSLQVLMDNWQCKEWEMFLFIENWYSADPDQRKNSLNKLMSFVRFSLMSMKQLDCVLDSAVYVYNKDSWHDLVAQAIEYNNLPVHQRVIQQTEQSKARNAAIPVFFTTGEYEDASTFFNLPIDIAWIPHAKETRNTPKFSNYRPVGVAVNNFFVITFVSEENQEFHIFDPRTITWSQMATVARPKSDFTMVYHKGHMFVLGGTYIDYAEIGNDIEEVHETDKYSFQTNEWTSILAVPHTMVDPTACVIGDIVYVCDAPSLYSLDLSSDEHRWEEKKSCVDMRIAEPMHVMAIHGEQVIVVIHLAGSQSGDGDEILMYSPAQNQWSMLEHSCTKYFDKIFKSDDCMMIPDGNSIYLLNLHGYHGDIEDYESLRDEDNWTVSVCLRWDIPEEGSDMKEALLANFPIPDISMWAPCMNTFGDLLAIPPHSPAQESADDCKQSKE